MKAIFVRRTKSMEQTRKAISALRKAIARDISCDNSTAIQRIRAIVARVDNNLHFRA
jgi:hypothetical protein